MVFAKKCRWAVWIASYLFHASRNIARPSVDQQEIEIMMPFEQEVVLPLPSTL